MNITELFSPISLLQITLFDFDSMSSLLLKFGIDIFVTFLIVMKIYLPGNKKKQFVFTYFVFNILIFFLCHLMISTQLTLGFAFGLFALFSIMRYRTMTVDIKDMTYLFAVVCVAVMNALSGFYVSLTEQIFINFAILGALYILETVLFKDPMISQELVFEKIDLIKPQNRAQLRQELEFRVGCPITKIDVISLNFLSDSALLRIEYPQESILDLQPTNQLPMPELLS